MGDLGDEVKVLQRGARPMDPTMVWVRNQSVLWFPMEPNIHIHCFFDDTEADQVGYTVQEFCCHACATAHTFYLDVDSRGGVLADTDEMAHRLTEFKTEHAACIPQTPSGMMYRITIQDALVKGNDQIFCPQLRKTTDEFDLRKREHHDA